MLAFRHSYENPLLTATSRNVITDIYHAAQQWTEVDMPRPLMLLSRVFGRKTAPRDPWFPVLRIWSEVGDICDAESFGASRACACVLSLNTVSVDGHRRSIVEHTIHVLVLPGLHAGGAGRQQGPTAAGACASDSSLDVVSAHLYSLPHFQHTSQPALALPGTRVAWPSPLHMQLRVLSRLEFNGERVTHHRDFWGE